MNVCGFIVYNGRVHIFIRPLFVYVPHVSGLHTYVHTARAEWEGARGKKRQVTITMGQVLCSVIMMHVKMH